MPLFLLINSFLFHRVYFSSFSSLFCPWLSLLIHFSWIVYIFLIVLSVLPDHLYLLVLIFFFLYSSYSLMYFYSILSFLLFLYLNSLLFSYSRIPCFLSSFLSLKVSQTCNSACLERDMQQALFLECRQPAFHYIKLHVYVSYMESGCRFPHRLSYSLQTAMLMLRTS